MPDTFPSEWSSFPTPGPIPDEVGIEFALANQTKRWGSYQSLRRQSPWYRAVIRWILVRDPICRCCEERRSDDGHHGEYNYDTPFAEQAHQLGGVCRDCHLSKLHPRPDTLEAENLRFDIQMDLRRVQREYDANPDMIPAYRTKTPAQILAIMKQYGVPVTKPIADPLSGTISQMDKNIFNNVTPQNVPSSVKSARKVIGTRGAFKEACRKHHTEVTERMVSLETDVTSDKGDREIAVLCARLMGATVTPKQIRDFRMLCRLIHGAKIQGFPISRMVIAYGDFIGDRESFRIVANNILDETGYNWEHGQEPAVANEPVMPVMISKTKVPIAAVANEPVMPVMISKTKVPIAPVTELPLTMARGASIGELLEVYMNHTANIVKDFLVKQGVARGAAEAQREIAAIFQGDATKPRV